MKVPAARIPLLPMLRAEMIPFTPPLAIDELRREGVVGIRFSGPSPLRLMSNVLIRLAEPAKNWCG